MILKPTIPLLALFFLTGCEDPDFRIAKETPLCGMLPDKLMNSTVGAGVGEWLEEKDDSNVYRYEVEFLSNSRVNPIIKVQLHRTVKDNKVARDSIMYFRYLQMVPYGFGMELAKKPTNKYLYGMSVKEYVKQEKGEKLARKC